MRNRLNQENFTDHYALVCEDKITDTARCSCTWEQNGIWVDLDYNYKMHEGTLDYDCLYAEPATDGNPSEENWKYAKKLAYAAAEKYDLPLYIYYMGDEVRVVTKKEFINEIHDLKSSGKDVKNFNVDEKYEVHVEIIATTEDELAILISLVRKMEMQNYICTFTIDYDDGVQLDTGVSLLQQMLECLEFGIDVKNVNRKICCMFTIPCMKKDGITLDQISDELVYRNLNSCAETVRGIGWDDELFAYTTEELLLIKELWDASVYENKREKGADRCEFPMFFGTTESWREVEIAPARFFAAFPDVFKDTNTKWFKERINKDEFLWNYGSGYSIVKYCPDCGTKLDCLKWVEDLWSDFGDAPYDAENECLDGQWLHFSKGAHREEIWHWFEYTFEVSVGKDLMFG